MIQVARRRLRPQDLADQDLDIGGVGKGVVIDVAGAGYRGRFAEASLDIALVPPVFTAATL